MKQPKFTIVLTPDILAFYKAEARRQGRYPSDVMRRVLRDAAGLITDPEATSKSKTLKLKLK